MRMLAEVLAGALRALADDVEARSEGNAAPLTTSYRVIEGGTEGAELPGACTLLPGVEVAGDEQGGANPSPAFATDSWPRETEMCNGRRGASAPNPDGEASLRVPRLPLRVLPNHRHVPVRWWKPSGFEDAR